IKLRGRDRSVDRFWQQCESRFLVGECVMEPALGLIKRRREGLGLSLQELADTVGVSKSFLSRIESGERSLSDSQAAALAQVLGAPSELLLLESGRLPADVQGAIDADAAGVTS